MTTTQTDLILAASLLSALMVLLVFLLLLRNRSSTTPSPTPTSTPPTLSVEPLVTLTAKMMEMMTKEATENRRLMETLMLGREQPALPPSSTSSPEGPTIYDPESTPLSPGIEAILQREVEEDEQRRLMKEHDALQEMLREKTLEIAKMEGQSVLEDSSPGPWSVPEASENPT